jgi:hypothetical protein
MSDIFGDAPEAHSLRPRRWHPYTASRPQIQIKPFHGRHVFTPSALPASPPTPESHSP